MDTISSAATRITCRRARHIGAIEAPWDLLVPPDCYHLRADFLRAAERGGVVRKPLYLLLLQGDEPVAAAYLYDIDVDLQGALPIAWRKYVLPICAVAPRALTVSLRVCGPPISSGRSGIWIDPGLSAPERQVVIEHFAAEMAASARWHQLLLFKDIDAQEEASYAAHLEELGYFPAAMFPNMVLDVRWPDAATYLASLRARYRSHLRSDLRAGDNLHWELCDSFAHLARPATALYENVHRKADFKLEQLTPEFFAVLSDSPQACLLVAREKGGGQVVGVNLLLLGDDTSTTLFVGLDYRWNDAHRLYFNLMERALLLALDRGCRRFVFGQTSYDFKSRLGGRPLPLVNYLRHPLAPVRKLLRATRAHWMFTDDPATDRRRVFRDDKE